MISSRGKTLASKRVRQRQARIGIGRNGRIHAADRGAEFCDGSGDEVWCTGGQAKVHGRFGLRVDTGMEVDQVVVDRRRDGAGLRVCSRCAVMCRGPDRNAAPMLPQGCNIVEEALALP